VEAVESSVVMRQKTLLIAVLGTALLVTAGVAGALTLSSGSATADQASPGEKSVSVSATGEIEAQPDQAVVRVAVTATGNDSTAVREELASETESLRSALQDYGLAQDAIRTAHYDIRQEPRERRQSGERAPYRGYHVLELTVQDTSAAGEVVDVAVDNGADRVDGVSFTLSDEKREELHNEALTKAMENARNRADTLAAAGDISVTGVHTILSSDTRHYDYRVEMASTTGASASSTTIDSGPVTVTANVRVTYNATAA
jgi:uncharacterized protein YggE